MDAWFEVTTRARLGQLNARLEAMKAANDERRRSKEAEAYNEEAFDALASEFAELEQQIRERG